MPTRGRPIDRATAPCRYPPAGPLLAPLDGLGLFRPSESVALAGWADSGTGRNNHDLGTIGVRAVVPNAAEHVVAMLGVAPAGRFGVDSNAERHWPRVRQRGMPALEEAADSRSRTGRWRLGGSRRELPLGGLRRPALGGANGDGGQWVKNSSSAESTRILRRSAAVGAQSASRLRYAPVSRWPSGR